MDKRNVNGPHLERMLAALRRRRILVASARALGEGIGIALAFVFVALLLSKLRAWNFDLSQLLTIAGASLGFAWFVFAAFARRIRNTEVSIDADTHLGLKDRLTSAYLFKKSAAADPLVAALIDDAEMASKSVTPAAVYPWRFPK